MRTKIRLWPWRLSVLPMFISIPFSINTQTCVKKSFVFGVSQLISTIWFIKTLSHHICVIFFTSY